MIQTLEHQLETALDLHTRARMNFWKGCEIEPQASTVLAGLVRQLEAQVDRLAEHHARLGGAWDFFSLPLSLPVITELDDLVEHCERYQEGLEQALEVARSQNDRQSAELLSDLVIEIDALCWQLTDCLHRPTEEQVAA